MSKTEQLPTNRLPDGVEFLATPAGEILRNQMQLRMWCIDQARSVAVSVESLIEAAGQIRAFVLGEAKQEGVA